MKCKVRNETFCLVARWCLASCSKDQDYCSHRGILEDCVIGIRISRDLSCTWSSRIGTLLAVHPVFPNHLLSKTGSNWDVRRIIGAHTYTHTDMRHEAETTTEPVDIENTVLVAYENSFPQACVHFTYQISKGIFGLKRILGKLKTDPVVGRRVNYWWKSGM